MMPFAETPQEIKIIPKRKKYRSRGGTGFSLRLKRNHTKYLKRKFKKELKKRARRRDWIKGGKKRKDGRLYAKRPKEFTPLVAPKIFSLLKNPEEILDFMEKGGELFAERKQVEFDLSNIDELTPDAIAYLVARVKDRKYNHYLNFDGINPTKDKLRKMFVASGFLDHVRPGVITAKRDKNLLVHRITDYKVENDLARQICELAVTHTFGKLEIFRPIFEIIIECMANTNNHAGLDKQGLYNWWVLVYNDPETKVTSFTFLDLGVGIFKSLPVVNFMDKLKSKVQDVSNIDLLSGTHTKIVPQLFSGRIFGMTRMKQKNRGQGLPKIYEHSRDKLIKNFTIMTNRMYIEIPSKRSRVLDHEFPGTLLYWELHPKNV